MHAGGILRVYIIPFALGSTVGFFGSKILADVLRMILIPPPFHQLVAYLAITVGWFAWLDAKPESIRHYFFCKACMMASPIPVATLGAITFAERDALLILIFGVLLAVGLGIGHMLGRILLPASSERAYFNSIKWAA